MDERRSGFAPPLPEHQLLVVSDLHLSQGRLPMDPLPDGSPRPGAGRFSPLEDFFFDEQFARFLAWHQGYAGGRRWHLVVNGDFFDFLQVIQDKYGVGTSPPDTVEKLRQIAQGHWLFFEALAGFAMAGHAVTIIRGNHDVELHYGEVQRDLRDLIRAAHRQRAKRDPEYARQPFLGTIDEKSIRFADWFYYEKGLLWIEHGNQYEAVNSFMYWLWPLLPADGRFPGRLREEIDLPLGSFFVRYLFNRVEQTAPFADNVKPASRFFWWLVSRHPLTAARYLLHDGYHMASRLWRATRWQRAWRWNARKEKHEKALLELARAAEIDDGSLQQLDSHKEPPLLQQPPWWVRAVRILPYVAPLFVLAVALGVLCILAVLLAAVPNLLSLLPDEVGRRLLRFLMVFARAPLEGVRWAILGAAGVGGLLAGLIAAWGRLEEGFKKRRWKKKDRRPMPDIYTRRATAIAEKLGVKYVAMGHTHDADLWSIDGKGSEYFNTGTWTKVFAEAEERLIREDVEFVFLQGLRQGSGLRMRLMEWDDDAGEPRLLKLFRKG